MIADGDEELGLLELLKLVDAMDTALSSEGGGGHVSSSHLAFKVGQCNGMIWNVQCNAMKCNAM